MLLLFEQRAEQTLWVTRGEEEAFQHVGREEDYSAVDEEAPRP